MKCAILLCTLGLVVAMPQMESEEKFELASPEALSLNDEVNEEFQGQPIIIYVPIDSDYYDELDFSYGGLPEINNNRVESSDVGLPSYGVPAALGRREKRSPEPFFGLLWLALTRGGRRGYGRRRGFGYGRR